GWKRCVVLYLPTIPEYLNTKIPEYQNTNPNTIPTTIPATTIPLPDTRPITGSTHFTFHISYIANSSVGVRVRSCSYVKPPGCEDRWEERGRGYIACSPPHLLLQPACLRAYPPEEAGGRLGG